MQTASALIQDTRLFELIPAGPPRPCSSLAGNNYDLTLYAHLLATAVTGLSCDQAGAIQLQLVSARMSLLFCLVDFLHTPIPTFGDCKVISFPSELLELLPGVELYR